MEHDEKYRDKIFLEHLRNKYLSGNDVYLLTLDRAASQFISIPT